jgi:hypothetical protein
MPLIQVKLIEEVFHTSAEERDHQQTYGCDGVYRGREHASGYLGCDRGSEKRRVGELAASP